MKKLYKAANWIFAAALAVCLIVWAVIGLKLFDGRYDIKSGAYVMFVCIFIMAVCALFKVFCKKISK